MRSTHKKLLGAVAVAAIVAASGSAFTGTGLSTTAGDSQFVGGQVTQTVTGATLANIKYNTVGAAATAVSTVDLTFADANADAQTVTVKVNSGSGLACVADVDVATNHKFNCDLDGVGTAGVTVNTLDVIATAAA
jgi:hypothetical protein